MKRYNKNKLRIPEPLKCEDTGFKPEPETKEELFYRALALSSNLSNPELWALACELDAEKKAGA
jgi:hypothetical protein